MTGQLERCLSAGMDGLLTKPTAIERLREVLERSALAVTESDVLAESDVAALVTSAVAVPPCAVDISQLGELAGEDPEFVKSVVLSFEKSMAQLLARMERDGLVERVPDPQDGRSRLVRLTDGATRRLPRAKALMDDTSERALAGFSEKERAQLLGFLRRVHANLEAVEPRE